MRHLLIFTICFAVTVFTAAKISFAEMQDFPIVKLQALDKSTARTVTFEAKVGSTIEYGSVFIKIQACRKSEPLDKPESAAFLQIWEVPLKSDKSEWIFSGWMFASSPALSAMDHPVYDVWVLDCLDGNKQNNEAKKSETKQETADQTDLAPADDKAPVVEDSEAQSESEETAPAEVQEESLDAVIEEIKKEE